MGEVLEQFSHGHQETTVIINSEKECFERREREDQNQLVRTVRIGFPSDTGDIRCNMKFEVADSTQVE